MLTLVSLLIPVVLVGLVSGGGDSSDDVTAIDGTAGDDALEGTTDNDFIRGLDGDDILHGRAGDDTLLGFEGDDVLQGEDGDDMLCSGDGDDIVVGNRGNDLIEGQEGNDWVSGDYGSDVVTGNEGDDTVLGGRGGDRVAGNEGDDVIYGGIVAGIPLELDQLAELRDGAPLADLMDANGEGFDLREDTFSDELFGGNGNDQLFLGDLDRATGGAGNDTFNLVANENADGPARILDFDPSRDSVTVVVEDVDNAEVTIETAGEDAIVRINGDVLARVTGAADTFTAADVAILSEASVASMFDPNA